MLTAMWCTRAAQFFQSDKHCLAFLKPHSVWSTELFHLSPLSPNTTGGLSFPSPSLFDTSIHVFWEISFNMQMRCTWSMHARRIGLDSAFPVKVWARNGKSGHSVDVLTWPQVVGRYFLDWYSSFQREESTLNGCYHKSDVWQVFQPQLRSGERDAFSWSVFLKISHKYKIAPTAARPVCFYSRYLITNISVKPGIWSVHWPK